MLTKAKILEALRKCHDPEIPVNLVDLGLIYGIKIKGENVEIEMGLTSPFCPAASLIVEDVKEKVKAVKGVKGVEVKISSKPWTPEKMAKKARERLEL